MQKTKSWDCPGDFYWWYKKK